MTKHEKSTLTATRRVTGKAFADRSNLRAHMQTHSTLKQYRCKRCDKSFALKSYLNKHYESACFKEQR